MVCVTYIQQIYFIQHSFSYFKVVDCDISALDGTEVEVIKIDKNNAWIKNE
jgi:hypothetical protein